MQGASSPSIEFMFRLKRNPPRWERILRVLLALALAVFAVVVPASGLWTLLAAATLALTALAGFCPACALAGRCALGPRQWSGRSRP